jgi:transposase InsO family protein
MCRVLMVQVSGFYAWLEEPLSQRAQDDERQTELIRQAWSDSGKIYGYRKLTDDLRDLGEQVSENRVARLASLAGILAQIGYKRRPGRYGGKPAVVAFNTLDRQFKVDAPDKVWGETLFAIGSRTMVERHHLHQDPGGLAVSVCRYRPLLTACGRLVCATPHDDRPGAAGLACGGLASQTQDEGADPFRSGVAVHQP